MDARYKTGGERRSAEQRSEAVIATAMVEFAAHGLHGASTERIARETGIAHSYVFKLFGRKKDLFIAATERVYDMVADLFQRGAQRRPEEPLRGMGEAFRDLLVRREELLVMIHGFAASGDDEIGNTVRRRYTELYEYARKTSGANAREMREFWAQGMLMVVAAAINLPSLESEQDWVSKLLYAT